MPNAPARRSRHPPTRRLSAQSRRWRRQAQVDAHALDSIRRSSMPTAWKSNTGSARSSSIANGYDHWIWDDTRHPPRPIQGFLKKVELALMMQSFPIGDPRHRARNIAYRAFRRRDRRHAVLDFSVAPGAGTPCPGVTRARATRRERLPSSSWRRSDQAALGRASRESTGSARRGSAPAAAARRRAAAR